MVYTAAEKKKLLETRFHHWHYQFDLGDGIMTKPARAFSQDWHDCRTRYLVGAIKSIFGDSLKGRKCLDVACNSGYWSFELARLEADRVLAIDKEKHVIEQAKFARKCMQKNREYSMIDFRHKDLFELKEWRVGKFDLITLFGVLYHLTDIVGFLDKVYRLAGNAVVIDTTVASGDEKILELADSDKYHACAPNEFAFVPSLPALLSILGHAGFSDVERIAPPADALGPYKQGRRVVLVARK